MAFADACIQIQDAGLPVLCTWSPYKTASQYVYVHSRVFVCVCVTVWWNYKHLDSNDMLFELKRKRPMIKIV